MAARTILAALSVVFLGAAALRLARDGFRLAPASRAWLIVGVVFAAVSAWLWQHG